MRFAKMAWIRKIDGRQTALFIAVSVFLVFSLSADDLFLSQGNIENVARQISLDAPIVFGETIVLIAGGIDISVGSNMAMASALAGSCTSVLRTMASTTA